MHKLWSALLVLMPIAVLLTTPLSTLSANTLKVSAAEMGVPNASKYNLFGAERQFYSEYFGNVPFLDARVDSFLHQIEFYDIPGRLQATLGGFQGFDDFILYYSIQDNPLNHIVVYYGLSDEKCTGVAFINVKQYTLSGNCFGTPRITPIEPYAGEDIDISGGAISGFTIKTQEGGVRRRINPLRGTSRKIETFEDLQKHLAALVLDVDVGSLLPPTRRRLLEDAQDDLMQRMFGERASK